MQTKSDNSTKIVPQFSPEKYVLERPFKTRRKLFNREKYSEDLKLLFKDEDINKGEIK